MTSAGKFIIVEGYSLALFNSNPEVLFVYEDNLDKVGFTGIEGYARKLTNTVAIPTKISATQHVFDEDIGKPVKGVDFKYDGPYGYIILEIIRSFVKLRDHLKSGKNIAWPKEGVGMNASRLFITAPLLHRGIDEAKKIIMTEANSVIHEKHS